MLHLIVILSFYNSNTIFFPGMQNPIFLSQNTNPNTIDFVYSNSLNYRQILSATMLHLAILKKVLNFSYFPSNIFKRCINRAFGIFYFSVWKIQTLKSVKILLKYG